MSLELFNHGIGLQLCINTSNFCHAAVCQLPWNGYTTMIVLLALNIYILNSNKSKQQNVIAYLYVALFLFNMKKIILIRKK
jgi:hypothetical protein